MKVIYRLTERAPSGAKISKCSLMTSAMGYFVSTDN